MNTKLAASCLVAAALMLPIAGYTADSDSDRSSPKAYVKDSIITTKIKAELFEEGMSSLLHIKVDTDKKGMVVFERYRRHPGCSGQSRVDRAQGKRRYFRAEPHQDPGQLKVDIEPTTRQPYTAGALLFPDPVSRFCHLR